MGNNADELSVFESIWREFDRFLWATLTILSMIEGRGVISITALEWVDGGVCGVRYAFLE
jgi:hypothetical protein